MTWLFSHQVLTSRHAGSRGLSEIDAAGELLAEPPQQARLDQVHRIERQGSSQGALFSADSCCSSCSGVNLVKAHQPPSGTTRPSRR
jgi:hypothetical protein